MVRPMYAVVDGEGHLKIPGELVRAMGLEPCSRLKLAQAGDQEDCFGNTTPACGGYLWAQGFIQCA